MLDIQGVIIVLGSITDKIKKFDWSRLVPRFKFDKYPHAGVGIDLTWKVGPGIGFGVGKFDLWFGWPRAEEDLHYRGCGHGAITAKEAPVEDEVAVA